MAKRHKYSTSLLLPIKRTSIRLLLVFLRLRGFAFFEASTKEDLKLVWRVRYQIYAELGYISPNEEGVFRDKYDESSVNILATKNGKPIGAVRLVLCGNHGFPTEALFNFKRPSVDCERIGEISRLGVIKEFRGRRSLILLGLIRVMQTKVRSLDLSYLYVNMPKKLERHFQKLGFVFDRIEEKEATEENFQARELIGGYFRQKRLVPYFVNVKKTEEKIII